MRGASPSPEIPRKAPRNNGRNCRPSSAGRLLPEFAFRAFVASCPRADSLLRQALALEPFLDQGRDLGIVLVHHHLVRIALDAELRQVDDIDAAAGAPD